MKKFLITLLTTAAVGAGIGALLMEGGGGEIVETRGDHGLEWGEYRLAVADQPCPEPGGAGFNYLSRKCVWWASKGSWCGCITHDDEMLNGEVDQATLPDRVKCHVGVCEHKTTHEQRVMRVSKSAIDPNPLCPITEAEASVDWDCIPIAKNVIMHSISYKPAKLALWNALEEKCCAGCDPGLCFLRKDSWGQCPYCLLASTPACDTYCLPAPPPP